MRVLLVVETMSDDVTESQAIVDAGIEAMSNEIKECEIFIPEADGQFATVDGSRLLGKYIGYFPENLDYREIVKNFHSWLWANSAMNSPLNAHDEGFDAAHNRARNTFADGLFCEISNLEG